MTSKLFIGWAAGAFSVLIAVGLFGIWIVFGGGINTTATKQHTTIMGWATHTTMINSEKRLAKSVPVSRPWSRASALAGAHEYEVHCVSCHGGPGVGRQPWVSGMLPTPPYLLDAGRNWSRQDLYQIVHDGIKMTAMPAWTEVMSPKQVWNVVDFLAVLPDLSPAQFKSMTAAPAGRSHGPHHLAVQGRH